MANLKVRVALKLHFETNDNQIELLKNTRYVKALVIRFFFFLDYVCILNEMATSHSFDQENEQVSEFIFYK